MYHQPAIILLDDLDEIAKHITDVQKEASGEALVHTRNAQGTNTQTDRQTDRDKQTDRQTDRDKQTDKCCVDIVFFFVFSVVVDFISELQLYKAVVIATASSKQLLHPCLLHSKGRHIFSVIEIPPPNLVINMNNFTCNTFINTQCSLYLSCMQIKRQEMIGTLLQRHKMKSVLLPGDIRYVFLSLDCSYNFFI